MAETGQPAAARRFAVEQGRDPDAPFSFEEFYLHDLPGPVVEDFRWHVRAQSLRPFEEPWPLAGWPDVPTDCVVGRHDRLYPYEFQRRIIGERLGLEPVAVNGGHLCALSCPAELARILLAAPVRRQLAVDRLSATRDRLGSS
jgi:pimeloyl-ACP methyl ester carboxylesterase